MDFETFPFPIMLYNLGESSCEKRFCAVRSPKDEPLLHKIPKQLVEE